MTDTTNASAPADSRLPAAATSTAATTPVATPAPARAPAAVAAGPATSVDMAPAQPASPPVPPLSVPPLSAAAPDARTRTAVDTAAGLLVSGGMAGTWTLDPKQSYVEFAGKHLWGLLSVRGRFDDVSGHGTVAEDHTVGGRLEIAADCVDTNNHRRDSHLRSARFLHTQAHPRIVLTAVNVTVEAENRLVVRGALEARGAARPVTFGVDVLEASPEHVLLDAVLVVDRTDFGITWSPARMASNRITAHVVARFVHASDTAPAQRLTG